MIDLNPLDVLKVRELDYIPQHFVKTKIDEWNYTAIKNWVKSKLKGRYGVSKMPYVNSSDSVAIDMFIGFEEQKEMTYFLLACPHLRRN